MFGVGIAVGVGVVVGGTGVLVGDGSAVAVDRSGLRVGARAGTSRGGLSQPHLSLYSGLCGTLFIESSLDGSFNIR